MNRESIVVSSIAAVIMRACSVSVLVYAGVGTWVFMYVRTRAHMSVYI